jgi:hypothetical protein
MLINKAKLYTFKFILNKSIYTLLLFNLYLYSTQSHVLFDHV